MAAAASSADPPPANGRGCRILALYRFVPLASPDGGEWDAAALIARPETHPALRALQSELLEMLRKHRATGTLVLAPEGINGTICYPLPPPAAVAQSGTTDDNCKSSVDGGATADPVAAYLGSHPLFGGPELRTRTSEWNAHENGRQAFQRLKVKIKPEIVTLGLGRPLVDRTPQISEAENGKKGGGRRHESHRLSDPLAARGRYLTPSQWDKVCRDPGVLVIDARNAYEVSIGTFEDAVDPKTENFSDFPDYLEGLAREYDWDDENDCKDVNDASEAMNAPSEPATNGELPSSNSNATKKKPPPKGIAMFCTGGIRCEKATSYAMQSGLFPHNLPIYHLEGGILAYLDDVSRRKADGMCPGESQQGETMQQQSSPESEQRSEGGESTFRGECFVFDKRVALTEGLKPSEKYASCHGCRGPMDRRLLLPANGENGCDVHDDRIPNEERQRHQQLTQGISHLPPLRYDGDTAKCYLPGLTCPRCHATTTRASLERFAQRERQGAMCAREGRPLFRDGGGDDATTR